MSETGSMNLDELKKEALAAGYTKIQREAPNAPTVSLSDWKGFSSHVTGGVYASVAYYLEGNRMRIHKTTEKEDHWYTLS